MDFPINSHAGEGVERFRIEEIEKKMQKEKKKKVKPRRCKIETMDHFLCHFSC